MSFDELLAPMEEPIVSTRNGTALSRYSEAIVRTFVRNGAKQARIRTEIADFSAEDLYGGIRRICQKNDYRNRIEIHKQDKTLVLVRRK